MKWANILLDVASAILSVITIVVILRDMKGDDE